MTNLDVLFLREDGECRLDVLVEEEVERGLPVLVDALGVQPGVDADHDVRLLHPLPVDVPSCGRQVRNVMSFCVTSMFVVCTLVVLPYPILMQEGRPYLSQKS